VGLCGVLVRCFVGSLVQTLEVCFGGGEHLEWCRSQCPPFFYGLSVVRPILLITTYGLLSLHEIELIVLFLCFFQSVGDAIPIVVRQLAARLYEDSLVVHLSFLVCHRFDPSLPFFVHGSLYCVQAIAIFLPCFDDKGPPIVTLLCQKIPPALRF